MNGMRCIGALAMTLLAALLVALLVAQPAVAEPSRTELRVFVSDGFVVRFDRPVENIFLADNSIADIQVAREQSAFLFGRKPGRTTLIALDREGEIVARHTIFVTYNNQDLRRLMRRDLGDVRVELIHAPGGAVLRGEVENPEMAERVRALASKYTGEGVALTDQLRITGSLQVHLRVRVAEVSRSVIRNLGINWDAVAQAGSFTFGLASGRSFLGQAGQIIRSGAGGSANVGFSNSRLNINALIDALATDGLVSILAEPNLTAGSGQRANFLAGGEFPIPVPQGNDRIGVDFRRFGVSLDFTPTVLSKELISIAVRPEVSELSAQGAVSFNGIQIPAVTTRRAETTITLGSGQSFVIGGLLQNRTANSIDAYPVLGDVPVLGALFRSTNFQRNQTELIIIVTPYLARPAGRPSELRQPTDGIAPPSDVERVVQGRISRNRNAVGNAAGVLVKGSKARPNGGFMYE